MIIYLLFLKIPVIQWKPKLEADAALPVLHGAVSAMSHYRSLHNCKAQTRPSAVTAAGLIPPVEGLKEMGKIFRRYGGAVVVHPEAGR